MKFLEAMLCAIAIPLAAFAMGTIDVWWANGEFAPTAAIAAAQDCLVSGAIDCNRGNSGLLINGSLLVGALGAAIVLFVAISAIVTGRSRVLLARSFPVVAFVALLGTGIVALGQALLLAGGVYVGLEYFTGETSGAIVAVVGVTALGTALMVMFSALRMFRTAETSVVGIPIQPIDAPHLTRIVGNISRQLKTKAPDNIVLGLDANFFATSAHVRTPVTKKPLKGNTLYLSLPLMRMMSDAETRSIIGHEMGHFSGNDTAYSHYFAPAYTGLGEAISKMDVNWNSWRALSWPAKIMLSYILSAFGHAERRISREREFRADQLGASVSSPEDSTRALLKSSALAAIWNAEFGEMVERVQRGRFSRNLSKNFVERTRYDIDLDKLAGLAALSLDSQIPHPTDTHPLTRDRIVALGIDPEPHVDIDAFKQSLFPKKTIVSSADSFERIEEQVTDMYQQIIAHFEGVDQSDETQHHNAFSNLLSMFLASMVLADGKILDSEIEVAQTEAFKYDSAFDPVGFKEYCRHPEDIPTLEKLIFWGNRMLNEGGAKRLRDILRKIAEADGEVHTNEASMLQRLEDELVGGDPDGQTERTAEAA